MQSLPMTHDSFETAYIIPDYPYGFTLRCQKRVWLEYKTKKGYRVMECTSNPKKPGLVWNKPKAGVYHFLAVLYLDDVDHVHIDALQGYSGAVAVEAFTEKHGEVLTGKREQAALGFLRAVERALQARKAQIAVTITETVPV